MHGVCGSVCVLTKRIWVASLCLCVSVHACMRNGRHFDVSVYAIDYVNSLKLLNLYFNRYFLFIQTGKSSSAVVEVFDIPEEHWQLILMGLIML